MLWMDSLTQPAMTSWKLWIYSMIYSTLQNENNNFHWNSVEIIRRSICCMTFWKNKFIQFNVYRCWIIWRFGYNFIWMIFKINLIIISIVSILHNLNFARNEITTFNCLQRDEWHNTWTVSENILSLYRTSHSNKVLLTVTVYITGIYTCIITNPILYLTLSNLICT
jgi:hypothetical protein